MHCSISVSYTYIFFVFLLKKVTFLAVLFLLRYDIYILLKDAGYEFNIGGEPRCFQGTIAFFSGDNLGSQFIGGFKEGSQAHRKCRECMGGTDDIQTNVILRASSIYV